MCPAQVYEIAEDGSTTARVDVERHAVQLRAVRRDHRQGRPADAARGRLRPRVHADVASSTRARPVSRACHPVVKLSVDVVGCRPDFAGIAPATVPAVPLEQHLAEKLHAYTRSYGAYAAVSSRPKDLADIVLMAELQAYDAVALRDAVEQTFAVRATHALPDFLAPPPPAWGASYGALAGEVGVSPKLEGRLRRRRTPVRTGLLERIRAVVCRRQGVAAMITLDDVRAARERIGGRLPRTPLHSSRTLGERVFLKAELFQPTGSFKVRGVLSKLATLTAEERARGVIGISAGNHAQALAWGARQEGLDCLMVMYGGASPQKVAATLGYGAHVDQEADSPASAFERLDGADRRDRARARPPVRRPGRDRRRRARAGSRSSRTCPTWTRCSSPAAAAGCVSGIAVGRQGAAPRGPRRRRRAGGLDRAPLGAQGGRAGAA